MARFEDLQQLWQRQPQPVIPARQSVDLGNAFRRYGRRVNLIYLMKAIVIAAQLAFLIVQLRLRPLALFGACVTDFSSVLFIVCDWRSQHSIARMNFAAPSVAFLRTALARLEALRDPFRSREFFIAMAGCGTGCNLMVASQWSSMSLPGVLAAHALVTAVPFAAPALGRWIRRKRFEKECRPLIDRLVRVLDNMERDQV